MEFVWATWRKERVGFESRMHSINGAASSVLSACNSAIILSSSSRSKRAKCLLRKLGSSVPSSSTKGLAVVSSSPGIDLSVALGRVVRKDGTGICNDRFKGGVVDRCTVTILLLEIAVNTSRMAPARVDWINI